MKLLFFSKIDTGDLLSNSVLFCDYKESKLNSSCCGSIIRIPIVDSIFYFPYICGIFEYLLNMTLRVR